VQLRGSKKNTQGQWGNARGTFKKKKKKRAGGGETGGNLKAKGTIRLGRNEVKKVFKKDKVKTRRAFTNLKEGGTRACKRKTGRKGGKKKKKKRLEK